MKKILIVDDDQVFSKVLGDALALEDFTIVKSINGSDGLLTFEKEKPDLVLLDMKMPGLDGIGFLKKLREKNNDETPIPVLIASNLSDIEKVSEGISLGGKGYISKSDETTENIVGDIKRVIAEEERLKNKIK